jgi:Kazal-type serine protease inhibitor domain
MDRWLILIIGLAVPAQAPEKMEAAKLGEQCGGVAGIQCDSGQWCELGPGQCNIFDTFGSCVIQRLSCPRDNRPECGCDGRTYANECERRRNRVAKDHDGEC